MSAPPPRAAKVIGAGPVGLASAIALAQKGWSVDVHERRPGAPLDKACGEGLMPAALRALEGLGLEGLPGRELLGIAYVSDGHRSLGSFPAGVRGRGVRRLALSSALLSRAEELGVTVHWGENVDVVPTASGYGISSAGISSAGTDSEEPEPFQGWIVAADGLRSPARRTLEQACGTSLPLPAGAVVEQRFGARVHFEKPAHFGLGGRVWVYWLEHCEAYLTPVSSDEIGLALLWTSNGSSRPSFEQRLQQLAETYPQLAPLIAAPRTSSVRGIGPLEQPTPTVIDRNLALVGDASGYLDAITGEGLALGLWDALDLADALAGDARLAAASYSARHRQRRHQPYRLIRLALLLSRRPSLRRMAVALLARSPAAFDEILASHVAERSPVGALVRLVPRLAADLVRAPFRAPHQVERRSSRSGS